MAIGWPLPFVFDGHSLSHRAVSAPAFFSRELAYQHFRPSPTLSRILLPPHQAGALVPLFLDRCLVRCLGVPRETNPPHLQIQSKPPSFHRPLLRWCPTHHVAASSPCRACLLTPQDLRRPGHEPCSSLVEYTPLWGTTPGGAKAWDQKKVSPLPLPSQLDLECLSSLHTVVPC